MTQNLDERRATLPGVYLVSTFLLTRGYFYGDHLLNHYVNPLAVQVTGVLVAIYTLWIIRVLGRAKRAGTLAVSGPFRWLAHPAYTQYIILDVSLTLWLLEPNWWMYMSALCFYGAIIYAMRSEEKFLRQAFGPEGENHLNRTLSLYRLGWR